MQDSFQEGSYNTGDKLSQKPFGTERSETKLWPSQAVEATSQSSVDSESAAESSCSCLNRITEGVV